MTRGVVAITGATGFLGRHLVRAVAKDGWTVRLLTRRDVVHPDWAGLETQIVIGALDDAQALKALCLGADVVIHLAGLIKAPSRIDFDRVNVGGARNIALAANAANARLVHVSSLSAREPALSDYAGSKRAGEEASREIIGDLLTVLRPPAIYGPGDMETLGLFKAAQGLPVLPVLAPGARIALIHVEDAAHQIANLAAKPTPGVFALSDDRREGYSWSEIMTAASRSVGRSPRLVRIPSVTLRAAAHAAQGLATISGKNSIFTSGKAREMLHLDWSVSAAEMLPDAIASRYGIHAGFTQSVHWYRANGFLVA